MVKLGIPRHVDS